MSTQLNCILLLIHFFKILYLPNAGADDNPWPLESFSGISSTFGEPRAGRFHMGVDCRTNGAVGKKVLSLGDGFISRVKTSPFGYGKALYITLDSGETVVYSHLSQFLPDIETRLYTARNEKKTYDVDLQFPKDKIRIGKRQIVAFSGDSGSGPPHLHLEIRDRKNQPVNPLKQWLTIPDNLPPVIDSIVFIPLDNESSVNGYPLPQWYLCSVQDSTVFFLSGNIGIGVNVSDAANGSKNGLGIYRISLAVDSAAVFSKQYDMLSYSHLQYGGLDYLSGGCLGGDGFVSALFRRTGNLVSFYEGKGIITAGVPKAAHPHTMTVTVQDFSGNTTSRSLPIVYGERPKILECGYDGAGALRISGIHTSGELKHVEIWEQTGENRWKLSQSYALGGKRCSLKHETPQHAAKYKIILIANDSTPSNPVYLHIKPLQRQEKVDNNLTLDTVLFYDKIVVRIRAKELIASLPIVTVKDHINRNTMTLNPLQEGETSWVTAIPLTGDGHQHFSIAVSAYDMTLVTLLGETDIRLTMINPYKGSVVHAPDSTLSVYVPPHSLYRSGPLVITPLAVNSPSGLGNVSPAYSIIFGDEPLRNSYHITLRMNANPPEKGALYLSLDNGVSWTFLSHVRKGRAFTGDCAQSGIITVLEDTISPEAAMITPKNGALVHTLKPTIQSAVRDRGSGLEGSDSITMKIDGMEVFGEYDYEAHTVTYIPFYELSPGMHTVEVTVIDRVGNSTSISSTFTCE